VEQRQNVSRQMKIDSLLHRSFIEMLVVGLCVGTGVLRRGSIATLQLPHRKHCAVSNIETHELEAASGICCYGRLRFEHSRNFSLTIAF
jgi:hypothetical protein